MNFADRDGLIWMDGEMVPWRDAKVHVLTHSLHYGMGVFEGVRADKTPHKCTCICRLQGHTDRLFRSAHIMGMNMPFDKATLNQAQKDVVRLNGLEEGYLRPLAFLGSHVTKDVIFGEFNRIELSCNFVDVSFGIPADSLRFTSQPVRFLHSRRS